MSTAGSSASESKFQKVKQYTPQEFEHINDLTNYFVPANIVIALASNVGY